MRDELGVVKGDMSGAAGGERKLSPSAFRGCGDVIVGNMIGSGRDLVVPIGEV